MDLNFWFLVLALDSMPYCLGPDGEGSGVQLYSWGVIDGSDSMSANKIYALYNSKARESQSWHLTRQGN